MLNRASSWHIVEDAFSIRKFLCTAKAPLSRCGDIVIDSYKQDFVGFASGTMLVKEQLTGDGELSALTVMAKGPEGYDAETNDWWWARIETSGDVPFSGNVSFCVGCHTPAKEATDWVFGVHLEDRAE